MSATDPAVPVPGRRGFTLIEVLLAMAILLVGGVSVLAVFTLAVSHGIQRDIEESLDLVRPEIRAMAQEAVDKADRALPPNPVTNAPTSQRGYTVSIQFVRSPNQDEAWVAVAQIAYQGQAFEQGRLPPMFLYRTVYDLPK